MAEPVDTPCEQAAAVIGGRASEHLARRSLLQAQLSAKRDEAATRMQAQQRRRLEQQRAMAARKSQPAREQTWSSGAREPEPKAPLLEPKVASMQPKPPAAKRVGGGYARKR